jgi:polysaccharide export outer membrane protein
MLASARVAVAASFVVVSGCASTGYGGVAQQGAVQVQSELPAPELSPAVEMSEYRIGPMDTINVQVFGAPELGRTGQVDQAGGFALPLVGTVPAAGRTTAQLSEQIAARLQPNYLRNPQVTVSVTEVRSQRITVDGAVNQPGIYPVLGKMSLMQAIAGARGPTEYASLDQIAIFRTVNEQRMAAVFSLKGIREGRLVDPAVYANDIIVVGESASRRRFKEIIQAIPVLGVFTPLAR